MLVLSPLVGLTSGTAAMAESISKTAPLVSGDLKEFEAVGIDIGDFRLMPEFEYIMFVDDNVYASPAGATKGDVIGTVAGSLGAKLRAGDFDIGVDANAAIRRYASLGSENSETAAVNVSLGWQPRLTERLVVSAGWLRSVEERGDPEARLVQNPNLQPSQIPGPRMLNIFETQARYSQNSGKTLFSAESVLRKYDFLGPVNSGRDFTSVGGSMTIGRAVGSRFYATATAFVTHRDFRLLATPTGPTQDETTIGGRLGLATREKGTIEGRVQVGLFRLNPADPAQKGRSGLSADVSLIFRPQRRTAITVDLSSGDVATFRLGAVARTDTSANLGVQQEIRHNLYGSLGLVLRRSVFLGSNDRETTVGPRLGVEWLANKQLSVIGNVSLNHRTSNVAVERFDRFRAGVTLRLRY